MKKRILSVLLLVTAVMLTACGAKEINVDELAARLASTGTFSEKMTEVSEDITKKRYGLDDGDITDCAAYSGTKAVVDEVAVFKAADVDKVKEQAEQHIDAQKDSYSNYRPDEVPKLDDSIVMVKGDYVIVCVSGDSAAAKSIIAEFIK